MKNRCGCGHIPQDEADKCFFKANKICYYCYLAEEEMKKDFNKGKNIVTKDMAIDAGMPEIEGMEC